MPPKKPPAASKKAENKKKEKVIEDKTFGLKNKKGNKNQKFIAQVEKQVKQGGNPDFRKQEAMKAEEKKRKEEAKKKEEEMKSLFKPAASVQKIESGVDPKSVFCAFFKQGLCKKGAKCKFSHDPDVEKKAAKRNIYEREEEAEENMDEWDEDKLAEVVAKKHGTEKSNATDIICKHFLEAVENNKYGWFWECPAGGKDCKYKHALPKGFVLKKDKKRMEKEREEISLEDLIEKERATLDHSKVTKVTLETFVAWKKKKLKEKKEAAEKMKDKKKTDLKSGKTSGLSGKEIFTFNPSILTAGGGGGDEEDEEGADFDLNIREQDLDDGVKVHEIKFDEYGIMDDGLDDSTETQLARAKAEREAAGGGAGPSGVSAPGGSGASAATVIDEDLFDDEDLDELEEDLEKLDI
eukprot:TRINITY_DN2708_c0_g1_i10.p1 TRINITY_DN2708_c0_g1~~TRINITY_DN2708_c0_g1_i10.p1  ORF type:complete len:409 (+),score=172.57 TRINITY_DN2708_c0_g1_i10:90-1316(+)